MEQIQTSNDAYALYQKLRNREEKLAKSNKGLNLLGKSKSEGFYISLKVITRINIKEKQERIKVDSNLPFVSWRCGCNSVEEFLEEFNKYCKKPVYSYPFSLNRKQENQPSRWNLPSFREKKINFEDIDIRISDKIKDMFYSDKFDFIGQVKKILSSQVKITDEEKDDFDKYFLLCEKIEDLGRQLPKERYGYDREKDDTLKMTIGKKEYNKKLRVIETKLKPICSKYEILNMPSIYYKEIKKAPSFEEFKIENKQEVEELWSELDDEDKDEFDCDFEEFLKTKYEENLEYNDFD